LVANGLSENQARQLARQRGLSYDQLINQYFENEKFNNQNPSNINPDTSILIDDENDIDLNDNDTDETEFRIKGQTRNYFGYNIFNNNPYLNKEYLLGNIDEGYLISPGDEIRIIIYGNTLKHKVVFELYKYYLH
jgi:hypothetical protein